MSGIPLFCMVWAGDFLAKERRMLYIHSEKIEVLDLFISNEETKSNEEIPILQTTVKK